MARQDPRTTAQGRAYNVSFGTAQVQGKTNVGGGIPGGAVPTQTEGPSSFAPLRGLATNFPIIAQIVAVAGQISQLIQQIKQFLASYQDGCLIVCFPAGTSPWVISALQQLGNLGATVNGNKKLRFVVGEGAAATVDFVGKAGQPSQMFRIKKDSSLIFSIGNGVTVNFTVAAGQTGAPGSLANATRSAFSVEMDEDAVFNIFALSGSRGAVVNINSTTPAVAAMSSLVGNGCDGDGEIVLSGAGDVSYAVSDAPVLADAQNVNCCEWNGVPIRVAGAGTTPAVIRFTNVRQGATSAADRVINVVADMVGNLSAIGSLPTNIEAAQIGSFEQNIVSAVPVTSTTTYDKAGSIKHVMSGGGTLGVTNTSVTPTAGKQTTGQLHEVGAVTVSDVTPNGSSYDTVINEITAAFTQAAANPRAIIGNYEADGAGSTLTQTAPGTLGVGDVFAPAGPTIVGAPVIGATNVV